MRDHHRHLALLRQLTMIVTIFTVLLGTSFTVMFAWTFIEPRFMFYAYDDLDWNSSMLGLVMNTYGIAMMLVEFSPSRMSDRLGRTPVILIGLVFFSAQFIGLAFSRNYILIATTFVIADLGNALLDPALSAYILDITPQSIKGVSWGSRARRDLWEAFTGPPW